MLMECILQYEDGGGETMEGGELLSHTVSSVRADDLRPSCTRSVGCTKLTTWRTDLCSPPLIAQPSAAGIQQPEFWWGVRLQLPAAARWLIRGSVLRTESLCPTLARLEPPAGRN